MALRRPTSVADFKVGDIVECLNGGAQTTTGKRYRVIPTSSDSKLNLETLDGSRLDYGNGTFGWERFAIVEEDEEMPTRTVPQDVSEYQVGDLVECTSGGNEFVNVGQRYRVIPGKTGRLNLSNPDGTSLNKRSIYTKSGGGTDDWKRFAIIEEEEVPETLVTPERLSEYQIGDVVECLRTTGSITAKGRRYRVIQGAPNCLNLTALDGSALGGVYQTGKGVSNWQGRFAIVRTVETGNQSTGGQRAMTISADLKNARETLAEERRAVRRVTEQSEATLTTLEAKVAKLEQRLTPNMLRGVIRNYRYGMNRDEITAPGKTAKALTHSFDLEIGQQVWLHIVLGVREWTAFVESQSFENDEEEVGDPKFWNGKLLVVQRDTGVDRYVPVRMSGEVLGSDRNGNQICVGDRVQLFDESADFGEVREFTGSRFQVRRDSGDLGGGTFDENYGEAGGNLWTVAASLMELVQE